MHTSVMNGQPQLPLEESMEAIPFLEAGHYLCTQMGDAFATKEMRTRAFNLERYKR